MNILQTIINWFKGDTSDTSYSSGLYEVVSQAWAGGFTVSSDFARSEAGWVAMAATLGFITTRISPGEYGRTWYATKAGIGYLDSNW